MVYYKGFIYYKSDLNNKIIERKIADTGYKHTIYIDEINLSYSESKLDKKLKNLLINEIYESSLINNYSIKKELVNYFNKIVSDDIINLYSDIVSTYNIDEIIYEIVKDNNGDLYGKELYTGLLFPILSRKNFEIDYKIDFEKKEKGQDIILKGTPNVNFSGLYKCNLFIVGNKIADKNEIDEYVNKYNHGFRKEKRKKEHIYFIKTLYNKNVFAENFKLEDMESNKKVKELEHESIETSLMEEIEYNLLMLKDINNDLYIEYKKKYEELLNNNLNKNNLALILGEIEFSLVFKKREIDDILDFINNIKEEYINIFLNNSSDKTELDLNKLDKISELFLKVKDKYNFKNQREVLNNLAFLYLMEVYENIDIISIEELENSYFKIYLKSIVMWIKKLIIDDIIDCSYIISLRDKLDVKVVLDLIRNITFRNNKDVKDKILRI